MAFILLSANNPLDYNRSADGRGVITPPDVLVLSQSSKIFVGQPRRDIGGSLIHQPFSTDLKNCQSASVTPISKPNFHIYGPTWKVSWR